MGIKHTPFRRLAGLAVPLAAALWGFSTFVLAADVPLVEVRTGSGGLTLSLDGRIEPQRQATVSAQLAGNVLALLVKAGDRVRAGQALARIDERDAAAGLQRSEAALAQAEAEARHARLATERTRDLRTQGFVSQAALDTAQTQLEAARSGVQQAQAARSQARLARGFAVAVAPFDGVVLATHLEAGDLASPGRPVATVYAPAALRATVLVPLSQADTARRATRVEVELAGGERVQPTRRAELASADPVSQTLEWRLDLPPGTRDLLPGQVARVHFSGAAAAPGSALSTLRLPPAAVLRRGELTAVYVAQGESFALRAVRLGADRGSEGIEVLAGLRAGDRVAADALAAGLTGARPAARVSPGSATTAAPVASAAAPGSPAGR